PCWRSLDAVAPGFAAAWALARHGCLAAGCCWGRPTESWMGMRFTERAHELTGVPIDQALVPTQLISSGAGFVTLGVLLFIWKRRAFSGQTPLVFLMLYSAACFAIESLRDEPAGQMLGLSTTQFACAITFPLAIVIYVRLRRASASHRALNGTKILRYLP